jgi:hypothetical protein
VNGETKVLYDIREEGAPVRGAISSGVGGVLVGVLLLAIVWKRPERTARVFALLWVVGWGGIAAFTAHGISARHRDARGWIDRREVEVVEGVVEKLSPATSDRKGVETFQIGERLFRVEDGQTKVPGLNRSSVRGGPVRGGATVRLTLHGESILRVEELAPPPAK